MANQKPETYKMDDTLNRVVHELQDFNNYGEIVGLLSLALPAEVALAVAEGFRTTMQQFSACWVDQIGE